MHLNNDARNKAAPLVDRTVSYLKELLGLLELQGVLRGLRLRVVGRLGLVAHEAVVRDHYGGREDGRGHEDGVAVDLLHGELGGDDLLLQCVSARRGRSQPYKGKTDGWTVKRALGVQGTTFLNFLYM